MNLRHFTIDETLSNKRLDAALAKLCDDISRANLQKMIKSGNVLINGIVVTSKKDVVNIDDEITLTVTQEPVLKDLPEAIDLNIVYEDNDLMVINKPAGLIVHPGAGVPSGTLLNAIIAHQPSNTELPQAGLIHRLDKDTTGLLIIAKNSESYFKLNQAMSEREIKREYFALVKGVVHTSGTIDEPLARHPKHRQKYTIHHSGKTAVTHYQVHERFKEHTLLKVKLETGRTHQIRVHMHHIQHPVVGDLTYHRGQYTKKDSLPEAALNALYQFKRQALHAAFLTFNHPMTQKEISLNCPLPDDFANLLDVLRS